MTETSVTPEVAPEVVMPELVINAFAPEPALIAELESKSAITSPKTRWRISIHSLTVVDGWVSAERSPATPSSVHCFLALKSGPLDPCRCTNANVCSSHRRFTIQRNSSIGSDPFEDSRGLRGKGSRPKADHATSHEVPSAKAFKAAPAAARIIATRSAICGFLLAPLESRQAAVMTARGFTPTYPAISAVDKPSTPLSTPIRRVRVRLRGVCRHKAARGIPPASSTAAAAIAIRLTPSCFGVHSPVKPSSMKRRYRDSRR